MCMARMSGEAWGRGGEGGGSGCGEEVDWWRTGTRKEEQGREEGERGEGGRGGGGVGRGEGVLVSEKEGLALGSV